MNFILFCVIACVNAAGIPSSMIALHKEGLGCFTPFECTYPGCWVILWISMDGRTLHTHTQKNIAHAKQAFQFTGVKTHEVKTPSPKKGEILIQVAASSVNPCDVV